MVFVNVTRSFSSTRGTFDKLYKLTKYVKPIDTSTYKAGDKVPVNTQGGKRITIPSNKRFYPLYPYEALFFKQQNTGLYGGLQKTSSKTCSESGNKNLRTHKPNIVRQSLYSEILNKSIKLKVATRVLKTIDKEGGLDEYLLKDKPARIKTLGKVGWQLRYQLLKRLQDNEKQQSGIYSTYKQYQIGVGKHKLLDELYPLVYRNLYVPITKKQFLIDHSYKTSEEICQSLEQLGYDLTKVSKSV